MLVLMALVTTFMAGPLLGLLDPRNEYGTPVEEELEQARRQVAVEFPELPVPEKSILVAPQTDAALEQLRALAEPLARARNDRARCVAEPDRERDHVRGRARRLVPRDARLRREPLTGEHRLPVARRRGDDDRLALGLVQHPRQAWARYVSRREALLGTRG
jgi:hypothetical protein